MAKKILVVDDEQEILSLIDEFLTRKGFQVIVADNGEKALDIIDQDGSIDLILLDYRMPKLDGSAVLAELKMRQNKTPVILLTGSLGKETRELEVGAFLMKPLDLDEVVAKIEELLGKS
ncbi:response regulator transcription factor [Candidatus Omnitrophota bacterium]